MPVSAVRLLWWGDVQTARSLRDAGHEVVLLPPGTGADAVVAVAEQEDVTVVGVLDADADAAAVADGLGPEVVVFWVTSPSRPSPAGERQV